MRLRGDASPNATVVRAPVGPGMIMDIEIAEWKLSFRDRNDGLSKAEAR